MSPVDIYKIQLEQIQKTDIDKATKDLAAKIVDLTRRVDRLGQALEKSIRKAEAAEDPTIIRRNIKRTELLEKAVDGLENTISKLDNKLDKLPQNIQKAVSAGRAAIRAERPAALPQDKELVYVLKALTDTYKRVQVSETYRTRREEILRAIEKVIRELKLPQRSIDELNKNIKELSKATGISLRQPPYPTTPARNVELFGKALKDMGTEFDKIRRELKDKIVITFDIETSAAKFGQKAAAEFITQIAYKKGKLEDILSGAIKPKEILLKPPVATEEEYKRKLAKGIPAVPFERLKGAPDPAKALQEFADALKDAEAVIGHNIAKFDIKVLEEHFKKAGVKVEAAIDKYVDTVEASRAAFPERLSHKLEDILKDLEAAGVEIKKFGEGAHDARTDVETTEELMRALNNATKQSAALQVSVATKIEKINQVIASATQDVQKFKKIGDKADEVVAGVDLLSESISEAQRHAEKTGEAFKKATLEIEDLAKVKSTLEAAVFRPQIVRPRPIAEPFQVAAPLGARRPEKMALILGDLAKSLDKLQANIVTSLEKGLERGAEILKDEAGKAFKLAPGEAEWELKIVDVRGLKQALAAQFREFVPAGVPARELIDTFKRLFIRRELGVPRAPGAMAEAVYKEVGSLTAELARSMGKNVEQLFKGIKEQTVTIGDIAKMPLPELTDLFKGVALEARAERELMQDFVKRMAIPAARVGPAGGITFETKYGAERALANFATVTTGLEKLALEIKKLGTPAMEFERLMRQITEIPLRPAPGTVAEAEAGKLAATLIKKVIELGGRAEIARGYRRAVALRRVERGELEAGDVQEFMATIPALEELITEAKELKITSLDVAKALDEISFENVYDILDRLFQAGRVPYLQRQAQNITRFDANMRQISKTINDLLGLMPLVEPGRPKRRLYDEQSLRVLSKATEALKPEEQKKHIIDVGMLWKDLAVRAEKLGEGVFTGKPYLGRPVATSLDLSDAASSKLKQFNEDMVTNLKELDKTMIGMSLADIRAAAPFKEFASIQRQMSYVTSALAGGVPGGRFEAPALLSGRERRIIESGRYGPAQYGLNVLTELRNTAQTFEDQIVISGKLAKAFTQVVGRLVKPAATLLEGRRITEIEPGVQRITPRAARAMATSEAEFKRILSDVAEQFQEILGVPQRYRGRADIAEIGKEIENVMREHRGKTIEVQTAKMAETFLNYFGRKIATRFGTKGVTVTPRYGQLPTEIRSIEDVARFIQEGFKAGVEPGPGLGAARIPKPVGQLLAEMFEKAAPEATVELRNRLIESGNKFIIEMFRDVEAGLVTKEEAMKQAKLFSEVAEAYRETFKAELPIGPAGIREIKDLYKEFFEGARETFELRPIGARISARGIAKRGLMPELLEGIVNNLIGTTAGVTTLQDEISKGALTETEKARKRLNEYMYALGYEPFKDLEGIIKRLKLEKPDIDPDTIKKLLDFEKQFSVYTDVVNEFGEQMQAFVAPKFLQIIEEPHLYPEWSPEQIAKGLKGARLDFQSFAAMAGVFGEGSSMMKELAASTALTAHEGWELLKAFQMLDPTMKDFRESMTRGLQTVKLRDIQAFEKATGTVEELKGTIFDIGKFPTPFKLKIPTTAKGAKEFYEDLYIPGPALRATYGEELLGAQAPTNIARYLDNLVDAAKKVEELADAARREGVGLSEDFQRKFASTIRGELVKGLTDTIKRFRGYEEAPTPQNIAYMEETIKKYIQALSPTREIASIWQEAGETTERGAAEAFAKMTTGAERYSMIMGRISDILIGPDPKSLEKEMQRLEGALKVYGETERIPEEFRTPYYQGLLGRTYGGDFERMMEAFMMRTRRKGEAPTVFDIELQAGNLDKFAKSVGINIQESLKDALERAQETLSKAKIRYFRELGESVFGKKKGIEEVFFQRVTPAITGKAISAIADKTRDLKDLLNALRDEYVVKLDIPGLPQMVDDLEKLSKAHTEYVSKARQLGLPVLKEGEIGLPPEMAAKIKVRAGLKNEIETTLADLIKKQGEVFVESIRYPFTGTLSVQPHRARILEQALGRHAIAVPGAPGFARAGVEAERRDIADLTRIIGTLREFIGVAPVGGRKRQYLPEETLSLLERREQAWAEGTAEGAEKAHQLTNAIEGLLKVINAAIPSFVNLEQKLDFDGDALFVHTGQLEESRNEIKKHFEALSDDVTGVRSLFRALFTAVKEADVATLAEMSAIFAKKHPREKGFEFLTRPFVTEEVRHLEFPEVMKALFTYAPAAAGLEAETPKWTAALQEWSQKTISKTLDGVFERLAVGPEAKAEFMAKAGAAEYGLPTAAAATTQLEKNIRKLAEELVRRQLWEKKYADAVTGQLYKLHTGQTVEGISRIARISELETGFGRGLAATGREAFPPAQEFLARWPKTSIALGGRPVQEFATRVNEIMRFVIQKGMDVKHAGVEAVGQQILANIGKRGGTEFIKKAMEGARDQWDELWDFNEQIENEIRLRLGKFSTEELKRELARFEPEIDIAALDISREEIMKRILRHVDITATFEELGRQIQRQAVIGLSKQLERQIAEMPVGPGKVRMLREVQAVGGVERFAAQQIAKEFASETGIAIQKHVTTHLQPLYKMRTSMETMATAAARTGIKIDPTQMALPEAGAEEFRRTMENVQKSAHVLSTAMAETGEVRRGGVHQFMVLTALQQRYKELEELQKLEREMQGVAGRMALPFTDIIEANKLAVKVFQEAGAAVGLGAGGIGPIPPITQNLEEFFDNIAKMQKVVRARVAEISRLAGLMPMIPEEEALLGKGVIERYGIQPFEVIKDVLQKQALARGEEIVPEDLEQRAREFAEEAQKAIAFQAGMVEQLRRVTEIMKTIPQQKEYLERAFPEINFREGIARVRAAQEEAAARHEDYTQAIEEWHKRTFPTERTNEMKEAVRTFQMPATAAAEDLKRTTVETADELTQAIDKALISRKRDALKYLEAQAAAPTAAREAPLYEIFRASALHGGGLYGGGPQLEAVVGEMLGMPKGAEFLLEATGLRGTAIHRRKQREFLAKFPTAEIEKPIEDLANRITGHIDVLYERGGQQIVTDIKTVYSTAQFERLKEIADEIEQRNITIQQKLDELKAKEPTSTLERNVIRRLEDYVSQVNVYLKNVEGAVGELLIVSTFDPEREFVIPIGKFDPARFQRDVALVEQARARVSKALEVLRVTGAIPEDLFADMPNVYKFVAQQLEKVSAEEFAKRLPTRPLGEIQRSSRDVINALTEEQERLFDKLSKEYLDIYEALGGPGAAERELRLMFAAGAPAAAGAPPAAPPPPPPPPPRGPGDDFDDEEELKKRVQEIMARMERGIRPEVPEIYRLIQTLDDALEGALAARERGDEQLAEALELLAASIRAVIERIGASEEAYREIYNLYRDLDKMKRTGAAAAAPFTRLKAPDIERIRPDDPEAIHKNLRALYESAVSFHRLAISEDIQRFGPEIAELLTEAAEKGPFGDISRRISDAIAKLPPEKRGAMQKIWMFYKKAVSEYFLNRLDVLKEEIERETGTPAARKAFMEYEQTIERFLANIRGTVGRMSDIFTRKGPTGRKTEWVDPEIARLVGIYRTPRQIEEIVRQTTPMRGELKPIMDILVGDLDPTIIEEMATPLQKVQAAFSMLTKEDKGMKAIIEDADLFARIGDQAVKAWDFEALTRGITDLRAAMQAYHRLQIGAFGGLTDYTEPIRKNVEDTIRYLKQLEQMFAPVGAKASPLGLAGVPPFLDPKTQALLHRRNIAMVGRYFERPEAAGGPEIGQAFTYRYRIVDPATKQVLSNISEEFRKIGETSNKAGQQVGIFTQQTKDLIRAFQERRGLGQAFGRVIRWGLASRTVYGLVNAMQSMVSTISDVELGIAYLRQVMSPLETDFEMITDAALGFAKQFGVPIRQVIDAMRVFAQQGLAQEDVIDRTRTSMLAANVTTLSTTDATEAITAAMKVYGTEGQSTIKFLDAWSQVEARHAITSADLANALKKAAAVAKTSGVTFDELNAIITGIGETTRMTGKEVGTSLRFMFRRIQAQKAPKELAKIGIPVIAPTGELRSAFEILEDLAMQWGDLTSAQRLNIATSIGGRRHYNALIVLMDHWQDVAETLVHSVNSKGAAERRNMIVMETYAKRLQQVREALSELQVQFGRFALPVAKTLLTGLKAVLETIANIPSSIKIAALAFSGLFVLVAKGQTLISSIIDRIRSFASIFRDFGTQFMKQFKIGIFETFGKLPKALATIDVTGLTTIDQAGKGMQDFESIIGKAAFALAQFGRGWNAVMSEIAATGTATSETLANVFGKLGAGLGTIGLKTAVAHPALGSVLAVMAKGAEKAEGAFMKIGELFGISAEAMAKWSQENASFVASIGPLAGSLLALVPIAGKTSDSLKKLALSADDYEKSLAGMRRLTSGELADINNLALTYGKLEDRIIAANKAREPEAVARAIEREEYTSPVLEAGRVYEASRDLANDLANTNISLIDSFDKFGNAIVKPTANLKEYFEVLREAKIKEIAEIEIQALEKYAEELTNAGSAAARFRSELKKFAKEIPGIGPLIARQIKVSPAQELKEAVADINKILAARAEFPLTTAFDDLFEKYNKQLEDARTRYRGFYSDFRRVLADLETRGLGVAQIRALLDRETLKPAFELMIEFEGRLKRLADVGKIDWEDILGVEILKRIAPDVKFDYAAELTKELYREAGILERTGRQPISKLIGNVVLFTEEIEDQFNIAGRQGILRYKEGLDLFVEAIDKELRTRREIPFESVKQFVDSIFPARQIMDGVEENIDILRENLVGAAAGIVGFGVKEFRRLFGTLGPRFFEQIPTEVLIQTPMGFRAPRPGFEAPFPAGAPARRALVGGGFGEVPFKGELLGIGFADIVRDFFVKPMQELQKFVEEPKRRLEAERGFIRGLEQDIEKLHTILKNNQVVLQYMALYVDLHKSLAEGSRILRENIAVEQARNKYLVETAGLLRGLPEAFTDVNVGIRDFFALTAQQRRLVMERALPPEQREFTGIRRRIGLEEIRRAAMVSELEKVERAIVQLQIIQEQAQAAGLIIPREDLMSITEPILKGITPGEEKQIQLQEKIKENTAATVEGLNDMLAATGDPKAQARNIQAAEHMGKTLAADIELLRDPGAMQRVTQVLGFPVLARAIESQFDDLVKFRNLAEKRGNIETVKAIDAIITEQSRNLIGAAGIRGARGILEPRATIGGGIVEISRQIAEVIGGPPVRRMLAPELQFMPGALSFEELISRAVGGEGLRELVQRVEKAAAAAPTEEQKRRAATLRELRYAPLLGPLPGYLGAREAARLEKGRYAQLVESPEFKNLNKLMNEQNEISVTDSKTLAKLFAAYGAFNDMARRAARREERGYDAQLRMLRNQQKGVVVKFKAGELGREEFQAQMGDLAKEISETLKKRRIAAETAQERATREAVGLIASATTTFARSAGFSESALEAMGKTAAGTIVAWHTWKALVGEEMPASVKSATDAMNEWAKTLGEEGLTWWERFKFWAGGITGGVGFGAAGRAGAAARAVEDLSETQKDMFTAEEKDKIRKMKDLQANQEQIKKADEILKGIKEGEVKELDADEKMIGINQDQLTTLIAIEENTRKASEGATEGAEASKGAAKETAEGVSKPVESMTQRLRSKLDEIKVTQLKQGGDLASRIKDLFAAATVVTAAGYLGGKTRLPAELGEARRRAEKLSGAFAELAKRFPEQVEAAIGELKKRREEALEPKPGETAEEARSRLLDAAAAYDEFVAKLREMAEGIGMSIDESTKIIGDASDRAHVIAEHGQIIAKSIEDMVKQVVLASKNLEIEMRYRTQVTGAMAGLPTFEELPIGKMEHELTATERLMKAGGESWQRLYVALKNIDIIREAYIAELQKGAERTVTIGVTAMAENQEAIGVIHRAGDEAAKEFEKIPKFQEIGRRVFNAYKKQLEEARREPSIAELIADEIKDFPAFDIEGIAGITVEEQRKRTHRQLEAINRQIRQSKSIVEQYDKALDFQPVLDKKAAEMKRLRDTSKQILGWMREEQEQIRRRREIYEELGEPDIPIIDFPTEEPARFETYRNTIAKINKRIIELRQEMESLETFGEQSPIVQAIGELDERATQTADKLNAEAEAHRNVVRSIEELNRIYEELQSAFEAGLGIARIQQEFQAVKHALRVDDLHREFTRLSEDVLGILRGGRAPEAPVWPTFAMVQAGVSPERLWGMTRAEQQIAEIQARQGRMPTIAELQEIRFNEMIQGVQIKQAREDDKLRAQHTALARLDRQLIEEELRAVNIQDPKVREAIVSSMQALRQQIATLAKESAQIVREIEPGVFERRGIDFERLKSTMEDALARVGEEAGIEDLGFDINKFLERAALGPEVAPVVEAIVESNKFLSNIDVGVQTLATLIATSFGTAKEIAAKSEEARAIAKAIADEIRGQVAGKPMAEAVKLGISKAVVGREFWTRAPVARGAIPERPEERQIGGIISGPGGPKEDKVPILASPGEYVIRAASAEKLGKKTLDYINMTGALPGFQEGGIIQVGNSILFRDEKGQWVATNVPTTAGEHFERVIGPPRYPKLDLVVEKVKMGPPTLFGPKPFPTGYEPPMPLFGPKPFPTSPEEKFIQDMLAKGVPMEEIQKMLGGLKKPSLMDPLILADLFTGAIGLKAAGIGLKAAGAPLLAYLASRLGYFGAREAVVQTAARAGLFRWGGMVPRRRYEEGGIIDKLLGVPRNIANVLKEKRLGLAEWIWKDELRDYWDIPKQFLKTSVGTMAMAALAAPEIGFRVAQGPLDILKLSRSIGRSMSERRLIDDTIKLYTGMREMGWSGMAHATKEAFVEDLKTGGTGITAGVIEALIPAGAGFSVFKETTKGTKIAKLAGEVAEKVGTKGTKFVKPVVSRTADAGVSISKKTGRYDKIRASLDKTFDTFDRLKGKVGLEKAVINKEGFYNTLALSQNWEMASKGLDSAFNQILRVSKRVGGKNLNLEEIAMEQVAKGRHLKGFAEHLSFTNIQGGGKLTFGTQMVLDPKRVTKRLMAAFDEGIFMPLRPGATYKEIFRYIATHELGHALTSPIEYAGAFGRGLYHQAVEIEKTFGRFLLPFLASGRAGKNIDEFMAEIVAATFHSPVKAMGYMEQGIVDLVKSSKAMFGIPFFGGGRIEPSYAQGTPFVPRNQIAMLHRGEAVIPAKYNMGGVIERDFPRFQLGGEISPAKVLQGIESAAEKFGEVVVRKLEEATIDFNIPTTDQLPELKIDTSNLEGVLQGFGAVGATGISKIDQFIEATNEKLDRLEEQAVTHRDKIEILETSSSELEDLERVINELGNKIETAYDKSEQTIDFTEERSYVETKISDAVGEIKTADMAPLKSRVGNLELIMNDLKRDLEHQREIMYSNINRLDLKE